MRRFLRRLFGCQRGAAAIEFALVGPMLIVLHLGTVETVQAWEAHRRVAHIASAIADLAAQNRSVSQADLDDILKAGSLLITPFPDSALGARVASITATSSGTKIDWQDARNWTAGGSPSVPAGYLQTGETVIVADVTFNHQTLFGLVLPSALAMRSQAYLRPRLSGQVALS
jgi:Flp pilus assembly protein TadG